VSTSSITSQVGQPIDYLRLPLHTLKVGSYGTHNALAWPSQSARAF